MERCIVCDKQATRYNSQQLPVCRIHEKHEALNLNCPLCKGPLDAKKGKYGTFFTCFKCGTVSRTKLKTFGGLFFMRSR